MPIATVTTKGQITIPLTVRHALNLEVGSRVDFVQTASGEFKLVPINQNIKALKGVLKNPTSPVSIEDMNAAIANMAALSK